ncbi:hypothetical protein [Lysobacter auxotrophicus]|uniref:ABC transporter permease n=1 Tax=Lysobacter auxotrophicus TaxID=2992573 RepID=A0ABM8DHH0_9GAMM|nr:hypothetical protein [Lysobacter auxotrophicus]BDU18003.1 hypothetical protein LA521A_32040 [Lysobacter auxotrophicus]
MTQRSNHLQTAPGRSQRSAAAASHADARRIAIALLTKAAPIAASLILVLVLITGLASAEYGFV